MNAFERAIDDRDFATVADSYNLPGANRLVRAAKLITDTRLRRVVEKRFGRLTAMQVCAAERLTAADTSRIYLASNWADVADHPDLVYGITSAIDGAGTPDMQRGSDGIWRMGRISENPPQPPGLAAAMSETANGILHQDDELIRNIESGKYPTGADLLRDIVPQRPSPALPEEIRRQMREQQKKSERIPRLDRRNFSRRNSI
jgi:hypothetical protein